MADPVNVLAPTWMAPRPMGKGPGGGPWSPQSEQDFQNYIAFDPNVRTWRNGFAAKYGEQPNVNGDQTFDYRKAFVGGPQSGGLPDGPKPTPSDSIYHWGSTGKADNHPTEWMQKFYERFNGADPTQLTAEQWTPEMKAFLQQQMQERLPQNALAPNTTIEF